MPTLAQIAEVVHGEVDGDGSIEIKHACEITSGAVGSITYLSDPKYSRFLASSPVSAVILKADADAHGKPSIRVSNPTRAFALALAYLYPQATPLSGVHPAASVGQAVKLGMEVSIGPNAVIGDEVTIGDGSIIEAGVSIAGGAIIGCKARLYPNVVIYHNCRLGDEVIIHAGTVIGSDGYGYVTEDSIHYKIPQVGRVIIGNQVEIGANSTIDRSTLTDTVIGEGTKIDNLVHIAHNVKVGRSCLFAAGVGIAGSTIIGDFVTLGGQVGVADHLKIGDRVIVAARAAVRQSIPAGQFYAGDPAVDHRSWLRQYGAIRRLPEIIRRLRNIEASSIPPSNNSD